MTVGDLRKALEGLPDEMLVLYAWTWHSPGDICLGGYMGGGSPQLLFDGNRGPWEQQFNNTVLWEQTEPPKTITIGEAARRLLGGDE